MQAEEHKRTQRSDCPARDGPPSQGKYYAGTHSGPYGCPYGCPFGCPYGYPHRDAHTATSVAPPPPAPLVPRQRDLPPERLRPVPRQRHEQLPRHMRENHQGRHASVFCADAGGWGGRRYHFRHVHRYDVEDPQGPENVLIFFFSVISKMLHDKT